MTPEQLAAIEARANAATPGPWRVEIRGLCFPCKSLPGTHLHKWADGGPMAVWPVGADGAFMAAARQDVPALVAEVRRLWALLPL